MYYYYFLAEEVVCSKEPKILSIKERKLLLSKYLNLNSKMG